MSKKTRSDFDNVGLFHQRFDLPVTTEDQPPHEITAEARNFRLHFLLEEMSELASSYGLELRYTLMPTTGRQEQDLPGIADALVDLVYVALGTAHFHGLPWEQLFAEVQRANMSKIRASAEGESKRKTTLDVVKPVGWRPPAIATVLLQAGWNGPRLPLEEEKLS